jgi:hypothetical protein
MKECDQGFSAFTFDRFYFNPGQQPTQVLFDDGDIKPIADRDMVRYRRRCDV